MPDDCEETLLDQHDTFAAWHHRWTRSQPDVVTRRFTATTTLANHELGEAMSPLIPWIPGAPPPPPSDPSNDDA